MPYFAVADYEPVAMSRLLMKQISDQGTDWHWYALVDCAFDHAGRSLRLENTSSLPLYHQGRWAALSHVAPTLFTLAAKEDETLERQLKRLLYHCHGRPMLSLLASTWPAKKLIEFWQALLEVNTEDQDSYLLRFADTRVLPAIANELAIWKRLAAPIGAWCTMGRDGQPLALTPPATPVYGDDPLTIDNACLSRLLQASQADAMADYAHEYFPDLLRPRDGATNYALLAQVSRLCDKHAMDGASEQYALALAALLTDGRLLEHPDLDGWLSGKAWQTQGMEDALADWMEEKGIS